MVTESVVKIYDITVNQFVLFLMFVACAANKYPYCIMPWFSLSGALAIWHIFEIAMTIVKIYTLPNQIPGMPLRFTCKMALFRWASTLIIITFHCVLEVSTLLRLMARVGGVWMICYHSCHVSAISCTFMKCHMSILFLCFWKCNCCVVTGNLDNQ